MNNIYDMIKIEGTNRIQVLVYALINKRAAKNNKNRFPEWLSYSNRWLFEHEEWAASVLLEEIEFEQEIFNPSMIGMLLENMMSTFDVDVCFCMLDGSFSGMDDLFLNDYYDIYAYLENGFYLNIAMDDDLRCSCAWMNAIRKLRRFFD